ncbi:hypothetical protein [uncultured Draconibacterium sp.]|uniref:hypothetical protein n=1 Tax=uncultured Draconibacterium sp. TaxID=1573823 RepID=UPI0029C7AAA6|nr:hypothetical protein [uncultured Draconibacterium sp.]
MKTKVLLGMFLIMSTLYWSCIDVALMNSEEEIEPMETSYDTEDSYLKSVAIDEQFPLQLKNEEQVGTMKVSNNANSLIVKFAGNSNYEIEEIQLWIGTDPGEVPSNIKNMPVPGKFPYKSSGKNEYMFDISKEEIALDYDFGEGNDIYLFAHAVVINANTGALESAWSQGYYLSDMPGYSISYSIYTPVGGRGCFSHFAFCGEMINETYYYDINKASENIVADNGEIIGTASYIDQNIRFYFDQNWMFSGNTPEVVIIGYKKPGDKAYEVYRGNPLAPYPPIYYYYGPLTKYKYYSIELNVQYCTTGN